jgi:hypothetical protein
MKANRILLLLTFICHSPLAISQTQQQQQQQQQQKEEGKVCDTSITNMKTVLVVGATGATGKHVVNQLLDKGHRIKAVVRKETHMKELLTANASNYGDRLSLTEASLLDLSDDQLKNLVMGTDAVVSCLGHNMNFQGMWGHPRRLVTDATKRLTGVMQQSCPSSKFILMGSNGVANPNGNDDPRSRTDRTVLWLLRYLVPPHADNEGAASYLYNLGTNGLEWSVVRPSDLIDAPVSEYTLDAKPWPGLFSPSSPATRANVAHCMVDMILNDKVWDEWKFKMPVLHDKTTPVTAEE